MRHSEVAKTPSKAGDNVLPACNRVPVIFWDSCSSSRSLEHECCKQRCNKEGAQHKHSLEEVGPAYSREAAQESVADDDDCSAVHGNLCIDSDYSVEQCSAGLDGGCCVDCVCEDKDYSADDLQCHALGEEPVGQVLWDCDGVVALDGESPETWSLIYPAEGIAYSKADCNPYLSHTQCVYRSRKPHENPCAHIRCAGRESRYPGTHLSSAQEVSLVSTALVLHKEVDTDGNHENKI